MARQSKPKPVSVGDKLRRANPWFEGGAEKAKEGALEKRRADLRTKGPVVTAGDILAVAQELEEVQQQLNPLEIRHEELSQELLIHWGHTGIGELKGDFGNLLFSPSFKLSVDAGIVQRGLSEAQWQKITKRVIDAKLLLSLGDNDETIKALISRAIRASATIKITPPSSRRPKSGQTEEEEEE